MDEDYKIIKTEIFSALDILKSLHFGISKSSDINLNLYLPYLFDKRYELTDETRKILQLYISENLSYESISISMGLSRSRVSNIINDGLRKIDFYRFGILSANNIDKLSLQSFFDSLECKLSSFEQQVVIAKKCELKSSKEIIEAYNISKVHFDHIMTKFNEMYTNYLVKDIDLSLLDIKIEINRIGIESVISQEDKKILSLYYGIINKYNRGVKLKIGVIGEALGYSESAISDKIAKVE